MARHTDSVSIWAIRRLLLGFAVGVACSAPAAAEQPASPKRVIAAPLEAPAEFKKTVASEGVEAMVGWIATSQDNRGLPFLIVDKVEARVFVFDGRGDLAGVSPALLGLGRGDSSIPGIGRRRLATIAPADRTTPAGRFEASLGNDLDQDILWVDYDTSLSLHRVIVGNRADRRQARLASPTPLDNRISYGCINVPVDFYDRVVAPAFKDTVGIVYILPETRPIEAVFAIGARQAATAPIR